MKNTQFFQQIENIHRRFESLSEDLEAAALPIHDQLTPEQKRMFEDIQNAATDFSNRIQEFVVGTDDEIREDLESE